jgi:hypothetical protein
MENLSEYFDTAPFGASGETTIPVDAAPHILLNSSGATGLTQLVLVFQSLPTMAGIDPEADWVVRASFAAAVDGEPFLSIDVLPAAGPSIAFANPSEDGYIVTEGEAAFNLPLVAIDNLVDAYGGAPLSEDSISLYVTLEQTAGLDVAPSLLINVNLAGNPTLSPAVDNSATFLGSLESVANSLLFQFGAPIKLLTRTESRDASGQRTLGEWAEIPGLYSGTTQPRAIIEAASRSDLATIQAAGRPVGEKIYKVTFPADWTDQFIELDIKGIQTITSPAVYEILPGQDNWDTTEGRAVGTFFVKRSTR